MRELTKEEIDSIFKDICPICKHEGFYEGPSGGMSQNIFCANDKCKAGFNIMGTDPSICLGGQLISEPVIV